MQRNIQPTAQRKHSSGRRGGISRAQAYLVHIFNWEHDLQHMIVAVGSKRVREVITEIEERMDEERKARERLSA